MLNSQKVVNILASAGLSFAVIFSLSGCSAGISDGIVIKGTTILQTGAEDFRSGSFQGTSVNISNNGYIEILRERDRYRESGSFTSQTINTEPFQTLLFSCNADTPECTSLKVDLQVRIGGKWSEWMPWGNWGAYMASGSSLNKQENDVAIMDEDVLTVKDGTKAADAVRYKLTLNTEDDAVTPSVRSVAISVRNNIKPISKIYSGGEVKKDSPDSDRVLDVPEFSQTVRDSKIAMRICSPTSVAMVLKYYGIDILPEECAWGVYDNLAMIFGNWAFNCAFIGSYGFTAYTDFFNSLDDIKREINNGNPVIASVRYKNSESVDGDLPVVHGAPIDKTEGHLIVICGFVHENGREYVVVNDPAAENDEGVRVKYLADEFEESWFKVVYVIHSGDNKVEPEARRTRAEFVPTGNKRQSMAGMSYEYILKCGNAEVDMGRDNIRTIMVTGDGKSYRYITPVSGKTFWFDCEEGHGICRFIIITVNNKVYTAEINLEKI